MKPVERGRPRPQQFTPKPNTLSILGSVNGMIRPIVCEHCCGRGRPRSPSERFSFEAALVLVLILAAGCTTSRPLPPADFSAPGWTIQNGQAVWKNGSSDLAGELIFARRADGSSALQFIKTPLPLVSAQTSAKRWTITFVADNRTVSGQGAPPAQLLWLHLACALNGISPTRPLTFSRDTNGSWSLENAETGESIAGFLTP